MSSLVTNLRRGEDWRNSFLNPETLTWQKALQLYSGMLQQIIAQFLHRDIEVLWDSLELKVL